MPYLKAIAAAVVAAATALVTALDDESISASEWITAALAVLGSAGVVWYVQNGPQAQYGKAVVGALSSALTALVVALTDNHISQQEWLTALIAAIVGAGLVAVVQNKPAS